MYHVSLRIFQQALLQKVMNCMEKYLEVNFCENHCDHTRIRQELYVEAKIGTTI